MREDWPAILLVLASLVAGVLVYPYLPDQVPSHWNIKGEVDGYSSRLWGAYGIPLLNAGIYLLMLITPRIDPRRNNYAKFAGTYRILKIMMICFFTGLYLITVLSALGYNISMERLVPLGVSLLIIVIGNLMGKIHHNYFVGIKLPWTLANEAVWRKTHRMAAPLWVIAGLIGVVGAIIGGQTAAVLLFGGLIVAVVVPVIYSYLLYRGLEK
ncbi:putative integral membrane protein [Desulfoscipio gibsoniae DSM 7213]|uniref:Putative integral membrane protein n=2 Tax=Desulfoscipio gibsoniae TaxID=102134 RepID=R4KH39_9FIRM|nr:putative integral membrane protein [Desulfoscipio gibsoniae DSM 7213]